MYNTEHIGDIRGNYSNNAWISQSLYQLDHVCRPATLVSFHIFVATDLSKSNKPPGTFMNEQVKLENEQNTYKLMNTCF